MAYSTSCYHLTAFWIHGICSNVYIYIYICVCVCVWKYVYNVCMYVRSNSYCCFTPYVAGTALLVNAVRSCTQHSVAAARLTSEYLGSVVPPPTISVPQSLWTFVKWIENADGECTLLAVCLFTPRQQLAMWSLPSMRCGATVSPYVTNCSTLDCSVLCMQFSESVLQNGGHYCLWHVA